MDDDQVSFDVAGALGVITLNRPAALNALTLGMIGHIQARLDDWRLDDAVNSVLLQGAGPRAFCAGGDVTAIHSAAQQDGTGGVRPGEFPARFFGSEYRLNHCLHHYPKPVFALVHGIIMGGGVGLAAHSRHRILAADVTFAMPETLIGFFPDVGSGWFLNRFPGEIGTYLALTGRRISARDCLDLGFADAVIRTDSMAAIRDRLIGGPAEVTDLIAGLSVVEDMPPTLAPHRPEIDRAFGHDDLPRILDELAAIGSDWALSVIDDLAARSPTALAVTLAHLRRCRGRTYDEVAALEYGLALRMVAMGDFVEGVRAALIDKDRRPVWQARTAADTDPEQIRALLCPTGDPALDLPPTGSRSGEAP